MQFKLSWFLNQGICTSSKSTTQSVIIMRTNQSYLKAKKKTNLITKDSNFTPYSKKPNNRSNQTPPTPSTVQKKKEKHSGFALFRRIMTRSIEPPITPRTITGSIRGRPDSTDSQTISRTEEGGAHTCDPILGRRLRRRNRKGRGCCGGGGGGREGERRKEERGKRKINRWEWGPLMPAVGEFCFNPDFINYQLNLGLIKVN